MASLGGFEKFDRDVMLGCTETACTTGSACA